jgi:Lrp/AsnC family leucine-responsive transcriptional regulator
MTLDAIDRQLILRLQQNSQATQAELAEAVGLAISSVNSRIRRLIEIGALAGFHARVNPAVLELDVLAFVFVGYNASADPAPFLARLTSEQAVLECHRVTGAWTYLLKVRVPDLRALEGFVNTVLRPLPGVDQIEPRVALSSPKDTLLLPVAAND